MLATKKVTRGKPGKYRQFFKAQRYNPNLFPVPYPPGQENRQNPKKVDFRLVNWVSWPADRGKFWGLEATGVGSVGKD